MDSRLQTSGMTEGELNTSGMTEGPIGPLCPAGRAPLSCPLGPLLSFPQVVSGNPTSFSSVPFFGCPCMGKTMDSRLQTSGMTEGGLNTSGMTEGGPLWPLCQPPLSFPQVVSGNPASFSSVPFFGCPCMGKSHGFPITNVGNDRRRIEHVGHDGRPDRAPLSALSVIPAGC